MRSHATRRCDGGWPSRLRLVVPHRVLSLVALARLRVRLTMSASEAVLRDRNSEGLHPTREQQAWFRKQNSQGINRGKWLNTLYTSLSKDWVGEGDREYPEEA